MQNVYQKLDIITFHHYNMNTYFSTKPSVMTLKNLTRTILMTANWFAAWLISLSSQIYKIMQGESCKIAIMGNKSNLRSVMIILWIPNYSQWVK